MDGPARSEFAFSGSSVALHSTILVDFAGFINDLTQIAREIILYDVIHGSLACLGLTIGFA